jgi:hypothetical protein
MRRLVQWALVAVAVAALAALVAAITQQVAATTRGSTPVRVVTTATPPYPLIVSFYHYPAAAGYALPFAVAPAEPVEGPLTYHISSVPDADVDATSVRASFGPDPAVPNGVQGNAEITVRGGWVLAIWVSGPRGTGEARVPLQATVPDLIPPSLGWLIGLLPVSAMLAFLLMLRQRGARQATVSAGH